MGHSDRISGKDRFDAHMSIANFRLSRRDTRVSYEWKVTLGLWAVLLAAPLYIHHPPSARVTAWVLSAAVVSYALFWLRPIYVRMSEDLRAAFHHIEHAEHLLGLRECPPKPVERLSTTDRLFQFATFENWGGLFQLVATILLAVLIYWVMQSGLELKAQ